jgi:hypothetical protein
MSVTRADGYEGRYTAGYEDGYSQGYRQALRDVKRTIDEKANAANTPHASRAYQSDRPAQLAFPDIGFPEDRRDTGAVYADRWLAEAGQSDIKADPE